MPNKKIKEFRYDNLSYYIYLLSIFNLINPMSNKNNKFLIIGLDSAEWGIIESLIEAGMLPNLNKIIKNGVSGRIKTLMPSFSPMLWTSIATGKLAHKHGILGFVEPDIESKTGVRPISSTSRKCKALWNIFHNQGLKSNVVGWWPSHPVEPISGVMVSNVFQKSVDVLEKEWPIAEHSLHGVSDEKMLASIRVHPAQVRENTILTYVPLAESIDQEKDHSLFTLQKLTAETMTVRNTALWLMENTSWDLMAVYFNELDKISHHFMPFHPPKLETVSEEIFNTYYNVITATYTLYDVILGELIEKAGKDINIVVLSDHGFHFDSKRLRKKPKITADISLDHNPNGFLCFYGPLFKKNETVYGSTLLDITPTILAGCGMPIGKDMDGKPLLSIFKNPVLPKYIDSWEEVPGDFGTHSENMRKNPFNEAEAIQQLVDLGYIAPVDSSVEEQIKKVTDEMRYNLSVVLNDAGNIEQALKILEELYLEDVVDVRYNLDLIRINTRVGNTDRARQVLEMFRKVDVSNISDFNYLEGKILVKEGEIAEAIKKFELALEKHPNFINLLLNYAFLCNRTFEYDKAEKAFKHLLTLEEDNQRAYHGLAVLCNKNRRYEEAVDYAIQAIEIKNDFVEVHYQLGWAFYNLEEYEGAAEVFETCLKINPTLTRARNLLVTIYKNHLLDQQKYSLHHKILEETRMGTITVVSGLPRSGTSLMMQLLKAGGLEILTDGLVEADESNPKGYLEFEPVKNSFKDNSWMTMADGKVVKVVAPLLKALKSKYNLRIIFMERDLHEIVSSQNEMLIRKNKNKIKTKEFDLRLLDTYKLMLKESKRWIAEHNQAEVYFVGHRALIENPVEEIRKINRFMDGVLDEAAMKKVVDPTLYRIKSSVKI